MAANTTVNARLRAEGLEVIEIEYDQMALCGGGVHCSCHELRRELRLSVTSRKHNDFAKASPPHARKRIAFGHPHPKPEEPPCRPRP